MRKEFVYSLAALGAIPVTVNATEVGAYQASAQQLTDATPLSLSVGSLPKGSYKLISAEITGTTGAELKITVNGTTKSFKVGDKAAISFELKEAKAVTITLEGDGNNITIAPVINLDFDFKTQGDALKDLLAKAVATVNGYEYDHNADVISINTEVGTLIETITNVTTETENAFKLYNDNKLWLDAAETPIADKINTWAEACEKKEAEYKQSVIDEGSAKVEKALADAKAKIQANVVAKADKDALSKKETDINKLIAQYKKDGQKLDAIEAAITEYEALVKTANGNGDANDVAYKAVNEKIDAAKANYTTLNKDLQTYLNGENYNDVRSEALAAMSAALQDITPITVANEAAHNEGSSVAKQTELEAEIGKFNDALNAIAVEYKGYGDIITAAYDVVTAQQKALDDAAKANAAAVKSEKATQDAQAAAQKLIDDLTAKIQANDTKETVANISDVSADESKIKTAVEKVSTVAANYNAYQAFLQNISDIESARDKAIKALNDFVAADKTLAGDYVPETYWAKLISNINGTKDKDGNDIEGAKVKAKKAYDAATAASNTDVRAALNNASGKLARLMKDGEKLEITIAPSNINRTGSGQAYEVANLYKNLKEAAADYQKDLDELDGLVKNLDIYTNTYEDGGVVKGDYKSQIAAIQKRIDALTQALKDSKDNNKTKASSGESNYYNYMTGTFPTADTSIKTDIAALKAAYEADQQAWEKDNLDKTIASLKEAVQEQKDALDKDVAAIEGMDLGLSEPDITKELNDIKAEIAKIDIDAAAADSTQPITELTALKSKCDTLADSLSKLKTKADTAAEKVKTNNANKTVADKAIKALKDKLTKQQAAVAADYADVAAGFNADFDKVSAAIMKIETAVSTAYGKEALTEKDYSADVAKQDKAIDDIVAKAKAAQENFTANKNILVVYNQVETTYNKVLADAQASTDAATKGYYAETRLGKELKGQLDTYKKNIDDNFKSGNSAKIETDIKSQLTALEKDIKAVAAAAKANADEYAKQQKVLAEAKAEWNRVYLAISASDESSQLADYQQQLNKLNEQLLDIELNQIDENYNTGKSASEDLSTTLTGIIGEIQAIEAAQQAGYDEAITADNKKMYEETIPAAKKGATDAYTFAVNTMEAYQNAQSGELKAALETVTKESETLTEALKEFSTDIQDKQDAIDKKYKNTKSPATFNKEDSEGYIAYFEGKQTEIELALANFQNAINAEIGTALTTAINNYGTTISEAKTVVSGYLKDADSSLKDKDVTAKLTTLFSEADQLKADLDDAQEKNDIKALDNALVAAANKSTGIAAKVTAVKEAQAKAAIDVLLAPVTAERDLLSAASQKILTTLEKNYKTYTSKKTVSDNYATLKSNIQSLADEIANAKASDASYDAIIAKIADLQQTFDAAVAVADQFTVAKEFKAANLKQDAIDAIQQKADAAKEARTAKDQQKAIETEIANLKTAINDAVKDITYDSKAKKAVYSKLLTAELDQLKTDLAAVNEQYVIFANDFDTEGIQEQAAEYKAKIDELEKKVNADLSKLTDKNYTDYSNANVLKLEQDIASLLTELSTKNNAEKNTRLYNELTDAVTALETSLARATDGKDAEVTEALAEDIKAIEDAIAKQKAAVEEKKDNMVYYAEDIQAELPAIQDAIDQLAKDATAKQKEIDAAKAAAQAAYDAVVAVYDDAQKAVDAAKKDIDDSFAPYVSSSDFNNKFKQLEKEIADQKAALDINKLPADAKTVAEGIKTKQAATLLDLQNTAANKAQTARLAELEKAANAITYNASLYTIGDQKALKKQKDDIATAIADAKKAIEAALTADAETEQPYQKNGDIQGSLDDIQKSIDQLNSDIKALIIAPEGDANQDGKVSVADIDFVIEKMGEAYDENADVNGDGKVSVADIDYIIERM